MFTPYSFQYSGVFAALLLVFLGVFSLFAACVFLLGFAWFCLVFLIFDIFLVGFFLGFFCWGFVLGICFWDFLGDFCWGFVFGMLLGIFCLGKPRKTKENHGFPCFCYFFIFFTIFPRYRASSL